MAIILKNVKDEPSFNKIANLYKKKYPVNFRIKTKSFHRYAFADGIYFKSFYKENKFIGFVKGFCDNKHLYISWLVPKKDIDKEDIIKAVKKDMAKFNIVFVVNSLEEKELFTKLGFKEPKLSNLLEAAKALFMCTKPELFNDQEIVSGIRKYDWPMMYDRSRPAHIYYANVKDLDINKCLDLLPENRKQKALRYKFAKDQKLCVGAYLLLKRALKLHHINIDNYEFSYEEKGKPYLKDCPINFSISHSGDYACVAISKATIGVDIQETKDVDFKIKDKIFREKDWFLFDEANDKKVAFYTIWTCKEAYVKMTGEGLSKPFNEININYLFMFNGNFFYNLIDTVPGYQISACSVAYGLKTINEIKL